MKDYLPQDSPFLRWIWLNFMALCLVFIRRLFQFSHFCFRIFNFFDLSIAEETWVVEMCIWCINIVNVLVLHSNPWIEASAGGLLVHKGLYRSVAKYFGTCFKIRIWIELLRKCNFCRFISKQRIISLRHSSILRLIWLNFTALCLVFIRLLFQFSPISSKFPFFRP
jgi:hypothetical protein